MNLLELAGSNLKAYLTCLEGLVEHILIYKGQRPGVLLDTDSGWNKIVEMLKFLSRSNGKLIFIGNGGSAAIASHSALDFSNAGKIRAVCFSDTPLLTCLSNDYSYEKVFERAIEIYADKGDILVAISSSGESKNILNGLLTAKRKGCSTLTLTGFELGNSLMGIGDINIYVPIPRPYYGILESMHSIILDFLLNSIRKNPA